VIDPGSCHQQVADSRLPFELGQARGPVVNTQLADRLVEPDAPFRDPDAVKGADKALAYRADVHLVRDVTPGRYDPPVLRDHDGGRSIGLSVFFSLRQSLQRPADRRGIFSRCPSR